MSRNCNAIKSKEELLLCKIDYGVLVILKHRSIGFLQTLDNCFFAISVSFEKCDVEFDASKSSLCYARLVKITNCPFQALLIT